MACEFSLRATSTSDLEGEIKETGAELGATAAAPDFTGTVSEWYETLVETINDVSAQIHRKTLRGGANFVVTSPEVANIMEFTSGFRASVTHDDDRGTIGAVNVGSLSRKFDVYVDPYFPRNVLLVSPFPKSFLTLPPSSYPKLSAGSKCLNGNRSLGIFVFT